MSAQIASDLARLLELKRELLTNLLGSLRRCAEYLGNDDFDAFNSEMDRSSDIPAAVDKLTAAEKGLRDNLPPHMLRGEITAAEKNISILLGQLELVQKECTDAAEDKLRHYSQQIKSVRSTQKGVEGYALQLYRQGAIFIDEKK